MKEVFFKSDSVKDIAGSITKEYNTYKVFITYNQGNGIFTEWTVGSFAGAEEIFADEWALLSELTTFDKMELFKEEA